MQLGRLKEWREASGFTQRELASRAGIGHMSVVRAETGVSVRPSTARKIADALGREVSDLLEHPPTPAPLGEVSRTEEREALLQSLRSSSAYQDSARSGGADWAITKMHGILENARRELNHHADDLKRMSRLASDLIRLTWLYERYIREQLREQVSFSDYLEEMREYMEERLFRVRDEAHAAALACIEKERQKAPEERKMTDAELERELASIAG